MKADKKIGYFRNVGQEVPVEAKSLNVSEGVRLGGQVFNGLQTTKLVQPEWAVW